MRAGIFATPRPAPNRLLPVAAAATVLVFALPLYLLLGWRVTGWALAALLWLAGQVLGLLLARLRVGVANLAASGVLALGMMFRAIAVVVVLVVVAVSDAGPGIPADEIPQVFERFYRGRVARAKDTRGFGLGLAICRAVVENHGGQMSVESAAGGGATFRIRFPVAS